MARGRQAARCQGTRGEGSRTPQEIQLFSRDIGKIKDGTHLGWMMWAANVYFANFTDVDETESPRERLEEESGPENTAAALEGLKAFARSPNVPSLQELAAAVSKNSYPRLWYAFLPVWMSCGWRHPASPSSQMTY